MILIDSDHLSVLVDAGNSLHASFAARLSNETNQVRIPVVVAEEHLRGWLAQIRRSKKPLELIDPYERLTRLLAFLAEWNIAPWTPASAATFTRLRSQRIRTGTQDLRIAAIALAEGAMLLSANLRDFSQVPGLHVEDWLHG